MSVQAVETAVAVKQERQRKKDQRVQREQEKELGAGPRQRRPADEQGNARFRGEPARKSSRGSGVKAPGKPGGGGRPRAVAWAWSGNRKILTGQFVLCMMILILGALTSKDDGKSSSARALVKGSALALLFFLLALLSSAGGSSAKAATAMGTLVTAAYALTSSDVHAVVKWVGAFFKNEAPKIGQGKEAGSAGTAAGEVAGEVISNATRDLVEENKP